MPCGRRAWNRICRNSSGSSNVSALPAWRKERATVHSPARGGRCACRTRVSCACAAATVHGVLGQRQRRGRTGQSGAMPGLRRPAASRGSARRGRGRQTLAGLLAMFAREREFRRVVCPSCGEVDKDHLPVYTTPAFEHVRVEACDRCRTYIKSVDLTKNGLAIPSVDEYSKHSRWICGRQKRAIRNCRETSCFYNHGGPAITPALYWR